MTKKEKIIQWLKDKDVYEQFVKNFANSELPIDSNLIAMAFIWEDTPEGLSFWGKIDEEFCDWYKEEFADEYLNVNFFTVNFKKINN